MGEALKDGNFILLIDNVWFILEISLLTMFGLFMHSLPIISCYLCVFIVVNVREVVTYK